MALLSILIPSTYYSGVSKPSLGLSAGEITYDVKGAGRSLEFEVTVSAKEAPFSQMSVELSVAGSTKDGPPSGSASQGAPTVVQRPRGVRVSHGAVEPNGNVKATYRFRTSGSWSETRLVLSAKELRRSVDLRFPVPASG